MSERTFVALEEVGEWIEVCPLPVFLLVDAPDGDFWYGQDSDEQWFRSPNGFIEYHDNLYSDEELADEGFCVVQACVETSYQGVSASRILELIQDDHYDSDYYDSDTCGPWSITLEIRDLAERLSVAVTKSLPHMLDLKPSHYLLIPLREWM